MNEQMQASDSTRRTRRRTKKTTRKKKDAQAKDATVKKTTRKKKPTTKTTAARKGETEAQRLAREAREAEKAARKAAADEVKKKEKEAAEAKAKRAREKAESELEKDRQKINHRLVALDRAEGKAVDHRLAVAIEIATAQEHAKTAGVKFYDWAAENLHFPPKREGEEPERLGQQSIKKLLRIGVAEREEPGAGQKLLEDQRERHAATQAKHRAKKEQKSSGEPAADPTKVRMALDDMEPDAREELLRQQAEMYGIAGSDENEEAEDSKLKGQDRLRSGFKRLRAKSRIEFAEWVAEQVGARLVYDE